MRLTYRYMCNSIGKKWNQALTLIKILTHTHTHKQTVARRKVQL